MPPLGMYFRKDFLSVAQSSHVYCNMKKARIKEVFSHVHGNFTEYYHFTQKSVANRRILCYDCINI